MDLMGSAEVVPIEVLRMSVAVSYIIIAPVLCNYTTDCHWNDFELNFVNMTCSTQVLSCGKVQAAW